MNCGALQIVRAYEWHDVNARMVGLVMNENNDARVLLDDLERSEKSKVV